MQKKTFYVDVTLLQRKNVHALFTWLLTPSANLNKLRRRKVLISLENNNNVSPYGQNLHHKTKMLSAGTIHNSPSHHLIADLPADFSKVTTLHFAFNSDPDLRREDLIAVPRSRSRPLVTSGGRFERNFI